MGYLTDTSQTLDYSETATISTYIKRHGVIQFLNLLKKFKDFSQFETFWGDEIELHLINIDKATGLPKLQLNTDYMFDSLESELFSLQPEFGGWMLETVPLNPYKSNGDPIEVLENIQSRRKLINSLCKNGDVLFAGTVFPLLKVGDFFVPRATGSKEDLGSTLSQEAKLLNPHPRYITCQENVKARRGSEVSALIPIFKDEFTSFEETAEEPYPGFIYMDDFIFGPGSTSLQITFGTRNIEEARYLTDQMSVFSSIILPLSAASPVFKGKLADTDLRWNILSEIVDSRTSEERDSSHASYVPKSRWTSVSRYISDRPECKENFNDVNYPLDEEMMHFAREKAKQMGLEVDERLVSHLGFLFKQDPLVVYSDRIYVDDMKTTNHFENIQSTNWNNVRFKPPPGFDSEVGWRVELRSIEAQLTAEESVAFAMFSYFIAEMIVKKNYNFYIPISKVDENLNRAHKRDAILTEKFWFRKDIERDSQDQWVELSLDEILHGKKNTFIGLLNLVYQFCKEEYGVDMEEEWRKKKEDEALKVHKVVENMRFLEILSKRARGKSPTIAKWIRTFVAKHPKYMKDSVVTPEIAGDLVRAMNEISDGTKAYEDF